MAYKINGEVGFTSNIDKIVNDITKALRKIPSVKIRVDDSGIKRLEKTLKDINRTILSTNLGNTQRGLNGLSSSARGTSKSFKDLKGSIKDSHTELEKFGKSTAATLRRFSAFVGVVTIFNTIRDGFRESSREAINFEKEMLKISQVTGLAYNDLGDLNKEITRLSTTLGVSSTKLLNVALTLSQAGISARDTKKALDILAKTELSATFENIESTAEGAIAVMSQFGTSVDDLDKQLSSINTISAKFAVESSDLITAIRKAGGAFKATGGDLNELNALFTSVRASTRESADSIATGLRTIFTRLERPKTLAFLKEIGIELTNNEGQFIGTYKAVETLSKSLEKLSGYDPRYIQILEEIGGYRQISRTVALLKQFETSQKVLSVAQRAGNSITKDVEIAQKGLANQFARVREEFNAFVRSLSEDAQIRGFIQLTLQLSSALIKVADALKPIIPLAGLFIGAKVAKNLTGPFAKGFLGEYGVKRFKRGGPVPGIGSGDTVPAMLEPGEFVINKSAVQAFGAKNLGRINKYAGGGPIGWDTIDGVSQRRLNIVNRKSVLKILNEFKKDTGIDPSRLVNKVNIRDIKEGRPTVRGEFRATSIGSEIDKRINIYSSQFKDLAALKRTIYHELAHAIDFRGMKDGRNQFRSELSGTFGNAIAKKYSIIEQRRLDKFGADASYRKYALSNPELFANAFAYNYTAKNSILRDAFVKGVRPNIEQTNAGANELIKRGQFLPENPKGTKGLLESGTKNLGKFSRIDLGRVSSILPLLSILSEQNKKYAKGGSVGGSGNSDTQPALLTPGEFVINKQSAKAFGYGNLKKINRYAKGGLVGNLANIGIGGAVFGPQILSQLVGDAGAGIGLSEETIKPFLSSITLATTAILLFTTALNKDVDAHEDRIKLLKEEVQVHNSEIDQTRRKSKASLAAGIKSIQDSGIKEYKERVGELAERRNKLKPLTTSSNPLIAKQASDEFTRVQNELDTEIAKRATDKKTRPARIADEIDSLTTANQAKRRTVLNKIKASRREKALELRELQQEQIRAQRDNDINTTISIGAGVAFASGSFLSGLGNQYLAKGDRSNGLTGVTGGGVFTGGASGAILGGSIGSFIPGVGNGIGALVGGGIGALIGGFTAFRSAVTDLNKGDFTKKFESFSKNLAAVVSGKSTVSAQRGGINNFLRTANSGFLTKTGDEFQSLNAEVSSAVDGLEVYLSKVIALGGSTDEIIKQNQDLILVLSRFGNQGLGEVENRVKEQVKIRDNQIKAEKDFVKLQEENSRRLSAILSIGSAVAESSSSINNMGAALDTIEQFTTGISSIRSRFDFSALEDVGGFSVDSVSKQARQASALIGGSSGQLANDVIESAKVLQNLPTILSNLVNRNQLGEGERDIETELKDAIGEGFAQNLILSKFRTVVGGTENTAEFLKKFREDPAAVTKELQSAVDPIANALRDSLPSILEQFDLFSDGLAKYRENFFRSLDGLAKVIDIQELSEGLNAGFTGRTRTLAEKQAFETQRFNLLSGGSNVGQLGTRLGIAQANISNLSALRQNSEIGSDKFKELTLAIESNVREEEQVRRALEFSADVNTRLANTQEELEKLQRTREAKTNLAKDFVFGDAESKREILRGILGVAQLQSNLGAGKSPLAGLSPQLIGSTRGLLETFGESKIFGGKTGNELLKETVAKSIGFNPNALNTEEQNILAKANDIIKNSIEAQNTLNQNLTNNNDKFLQGLGQKFDTFFVNLKENFAQRANKEKQDNELIKAGKIAGIDQKIGILRGFQGAGVNINQDNLSAFRDAVAKVREAENKAGNPLQILGAGDRFKAGGFKDTRELERVLGKDFIKKFESFKDTEVPSKIFGLPDEAVKTIANKKIEQFVNKALSEEVRKRDKEREETLRQVDVNFPDIVDSIIRNLTKFEAGLKILGESDTLDKLNKEKAELRANGGMVWSKRGTDTVPAMTTDGQPFMLTPGEMVMNRRAVAKYGPALQRMNYAANGTRIGQFGDNIFTGSRQLGDGYVRPEYLDRLIKRGQKQHESFLKVMRESQIKRGVIPNSSAANATFSYDLEGNIVNDEQGLRGKFGQFDSTRTKAPSGFAIQRAKPVLSRGQIDDIRAGGFGIARPLESRANIFEARAAFEHNSPRAQAARARRADQLQQIRDQKQAREDFFNQRNRVTGSPVGPSVGLDIQNANQPKQPSPQAVQEMNKIVEKMNGMKMEIVLSGTLNVNISEGNLSERTREALKEFAQNYVEDKIKLEINKLIGDANLGVIPRPIGQKEGKK